MPISVQRSKNSKQCRQVSPYNGKKQKIPKANWLNTSLLFPCTFIQFIGRKQCKPVDCIITANIEHSNTGSNELIVYLGKQLSFKQLVFKAHLYLLETQPYLTGFSMLLLAPTPHFGKKLSRGMCDGFTFPRGTLCYRTQSKRWQIEVLAIILNKRHCLPAKNIPSQVLQSVDHN